MTAYYEHRSQHGDQGPIVPLVATTPAMQHRRGSSSAALVIASIWLALTLLFAMMLFTAELNAVHPLGSYEVYGGDAYTGIQNAVVDSERTIAAGLNQSNQLLRDIISGLGFLVIGSGILPFVTVLALRAKTS